MATTTSREGRPWAPRSNYLAAFDDLDRDWLNLCRRHRRNDAIADWVRTQPALQDVRTLADLIPAGHVDRTSTFQALVSLTRSGEPLAARAVLQLLVPGLVCLAVRIRSRQRPDLAYDLVAATWRYIARIQCGDLICHTADYILRSARRDVTYKPSHHCREALALADEAPIDERAPTARAACEPDGASESIVRMILDQAQREGGISPSARTIVWYRDVLGHDMATSAAAAGRAPSSAYRLRQQAHRSLRLFLSDTGSPESAIGQSTATATSSQFHDRTTTTQRRRR